MKTRCTNRYTKRPARLPFDSNTKPQKNLEVFQRIAWPGVNIASIF